MRMGRFQVFAVLFADCIGLRNVRLNYRQYDPGHISENIIYNDLIRRGYSMDIGVVVDRQNKDMAPGKVFGPYPPEIQYVLLGISVPESFPREDHRSFF